MFINAREHQENPQNGGRGDPELVTRSQELVVICSWRINHVSTVVCCYPLSRKRPKEGSLLGEWETPLRSGGTAAVEGLVGGGGEKGCRLRNWQGDWGR